MRNKGNADYTNRPLNDAELEFAALPENHNMIFEYMRFKKLDAETFYDELVMDYLTAVKKYVTEKPELQIHYSFKQVLFQQLNGRMMHYWREHYNKSNTTEREALRLDYEYEDDRNGNSRRIEPIWIDPMQNVERYVIEKEFLREIYENIDRYGESGLLKLIIDMRQEGYSNRDIARKAVITLSDYEGWGIMDILELIGIITHGSSSSQLQRLYRDTEKYGNVEKFIEWEEARKG